MSDNKVVYFKSIGDFFNGNGFIGSNIFLLRFHEGQHVWSELSEKRFVVAECPLSVESVCQ